jgi:predicted AlkP superfamily pyrophosphatase or phosphodiesterase
LLRVVTIVGLLAACSGPPVRPDRVGPEARLKLVVLIVVDQLPSWVFERDRSHFTAGFARLLRDGGYVRAAELPYANPFTAPGHASIATGVTPNVHGVLANTWYRRDEGRERSAEYDPDATAYSVGPSHGGELTADVTASGNALRVEGIADRLRLASDERARSVAIGLKPRAASFLAGRRPDLAVWYEAAAGGMTTSRAYAPEVPRWLFDLARDRPASRFFKQVWTPLDDQLLATATGIADDAPGEGSAHGLDRTFPHDLAASDSPAKAFFHTPYADEVVLDTVLASLDAMQLGSDDVPDLLAISFNAHDYAGHLWGPDSWESLDLTLRFDRTLGQLFDTLDTRLGRDGWAVVLTSDHGATPVVDRARGNGRRITSLEIMHAAETELERKLGRGPWVASVIASNVYLAPAFASAPDRDEALTAAAIAVGKLPGVAAAGRIDHITRGCEQRTGLERAICLSAVEGQSGELYVVPAAGSLITDYTTGTHHDAPFDDNRHVPILVMAPGLAAQTGEGSILQVAPTLAALLGIRPPSATSEPPLFKIAPARSSLNP